MHENEIDIEKKHQTLVKIWLAFLSAQILFLVGLYLVKPAVFAFELSAPVLGENKILILALAAIGVHNFILSFISRRRHLRHAFEKKSIESVQTALIVGCSLCASIFLLGFFLAHAFDYPYFFFWIILGILGNMLHFPRRSDVRITRASE